MFYLLLFYLKKPTNCSIQKPKVSNFISLYFITLLLSIPFGLLINLLTRYFPLKDLTKTPLQHPSHYFILLVILMAPLTEEILFRSWLRFSKFNYLLLISTLGIYSIYFAFQSKVIAPVITAVVLISLLVCVQKFSRETIDCFINSKFRYFFYATTALFGLMHTFNYSGDISVLLLFSIILSGRQLIIGLVLGFIRMNYGLVYSILFHMMNNAIVLFMMIKK